MRKLIALSVLALLLRVDLSAQGPCGLSRLPQQRYFQAVTYTSSADQSATGSIRCGAHVTSTLPNATVNYAGEGSYNLNASEYILLEEGTLITPSGDGYLLAEIRDVCSLTNTKDQHRKGNSGTLVAESLTLNVFPNPGKGEFQLRFADDAAKSILVTDMTGRIVLQQEVSAEAMVLDLQQEQNGVYFIQVKSNSGTDFCKLIKQD